MQQALPMATQQQFLAQAQAGAAYATQQAPYVINPGQEGPYVGLIPGYYGMTPWGMYPANLIPQQGAQPRRPLTPNQQVQGAEQQPYQIAFYDQNGSLMMGPRTPMRLVSPAPVLVPPSGPRAPQAPPAIYPPQPTQQNPMYQSQNGNNVSGKSIIFEINCVCATNGYQLCNFFTSIFYLNSSFSIHA